MLGTGYFLAVDDNPASQRITIFSPGRPTTRFMILVPSSRR